MVGEFPVVNPVAVVLGLFSAPCSGDLKESDIKSCGNDTQVI